MGSGRTKGRTAHGPGRARVEGFRRRQREAIARVAERARAAEEEAFWEETGASPYREAEELARRLHGGR